MKKLDWYIFKKYIGTFFFSISLLILIVVVFDVSENIDSFIKNEASFREVALHYYVPFIPYFINLFIYLFVFISVIFFTSKMAGHTEIIAILSSGVSFKRFLLPYIGAALLLSVGSFYLGNFLIPKTDTVRREFKDKYIENFLINHDFLLSSYMFSLISDKYFRGGRGLTISDDAFFKDVGKHFKDPSLVKEFIYNGTTDMFGDVLYAYGDIVATHLLEPVKAEGLSSTDFKKFMAIRTRKFDPEFLINNSYMPDKFNKVFTREVDFCKK